MNIIKNYPNVVKNYTELLFCPKFVILDYTLKSLKLTREGNMSKDGIAEVISLSRLLLSPASILFYPAPHHVSLSRAPLRGPSSLCWPSLGLTGFHWGCWKTLAGASHHQPAEVGEQASWPWTGAWNCLQQAGYGLVRPKFPFWTWNSQVVPLESLRFGGWMAGRIGGIDAGLKLEDSRNLQ